MLHDHSIGGPPAKRTRWAKHLRFQAVIVLCACAVLTSGCTTLREWWHNGLKVGPNYAPPVVEVAPDWMDAKAPQIVSGAASPCAWWTLLNDPILDALIEEAYQQNLDVRKAGLRILEAHSNRNKVAGNLLPQQQDGLFAYVHGQISKSLTQGAFQNVFDLYADGGILSWELDFWGKFRRNIESARADLDGSVYNYEDVVVILLADVATNYVKYRTYQKRLEYARENVARQKESLQLAQSKFKAGKTSETDVQQALADVAQDEARIPPLLTGLRQANNRLCVLMGMPPHSLDERLGTGPIPTAPPELAVGIPADLLCRRPDIRKAERDMASQHAQIGVAEADWYPSISAFGFLGYTGDEFRELWNLSSYTAFIVPSLQWKILNYGRIRNNVRIQNTKFKEKVVDYENAVLKAGEEVEDGLAAYMQSQIEARHWADSVKAGTRFEALARNQYKEGGTDFNRVIIAQQTLINRQDHLAQTNQDIVLHLIKVYKALGGGWEAFQQPNSPPCCLEKPSGAADAPALLSVKPPEKCETVVDTPVEP